MPTTYRATLTDVGAALVADAIAQGTTLTWAKMALGDGNGSTVIVDAGRTSLVNERYRAPLNDLGRDSANPNTIVGTLVVPPETGGWTIREFGIYDNASTPRLVAYGETPEIEKPVSAAGTGINLRLRFKLAVSADANITLSPDSNEAYATIEYVKDNAVKSLSVSGRTITYTMGDGDTHTIQTQDTTYGVATQSANGLMSKTDKGIVDNLPQTYYPLRGGTLNGNQITFTGSSPYITPDSTAKYLRLYNYSFAGGGSLYLHGKDYSDSPGQFRLNAHDGTNYKSLIGKPDGTLTWDGQDVIYQHPTYTARTGKPASNATPGFGDTVTVSQIKSDGTGHVTAATDRTITIPNSVATTSAAGLMSATDKAVLEAMPNNYYPITGGTIQGNKIAFSGNSPNIGTDTTSKYIRIYNNNFNGGGSLYLFGKDWVYTGEEDTPNAPGSFRLTAKNDQHQSSLLGYPDGTLIWNTHNVLTDAVSYLTTGNAASTYYPLTGGTINGNNITLAGSGSAPFIAQNSTSKYLRIMNVDYSGGASIYLYGAAHATAPGEFTIHTYNGTKRVSLIGKPDGALTWGGNNVAVVSAVDNTNSGYIRFTNGLQYVWGTAKVNPADANTGVTVTFEKAFSNEPRIFTNVRYGVAYGRAFTVQATSRSATGFNAKIGSSAGGTDALFTDGDFVYFAIGPWSAS